MRVRFINYGGIRGRELPSENKYKRRGEDSLAAEKSSLDSKNAIQKEAEDHILGKGPIPCSVIWGNPQCRFYFFFDVVVIGLLNILVKSVVLLR
jgi:hypothetical protein